MPKAHRTSQFNVALFANPKTPPAADSWWARPEMQESREQFYEKIRERADTVFAPSALPIHQGKNR